MEHKEIDNIINSQIKFNKSNSNSVNYRIQILNSLLKSIEQNEEKIYDALKKDLNKHEFESFLSEILLVKREIKVVEGNSLWRIARKTLGGGILYSEIYKNNIKIITNPNLIFPGQVFNIPNIKKK